MTAKKDLKKRVRERQAKTGERYTSALKHVLGQASRPGAAPGVEVSFREVTPLAGAVGLSCRAFVTPGFPEPLQRPGLEQLHRILTASADEPGLGLFRRALLHGEGEGSLKGPPSALGHVFSAQAFIRNLRLGIRGPSRDGLSLAFDVTEEGRPPATLVASLSPSLAEVRSSTVQLKGWMLRLATLEDWLSAGPALESVGFAML